MNKIFYYGLCLIITAGMAGCKSNNNDMPHEHHDGHEAHGHDHHHDHNHELNKEEVTEHDSGEITLDSHTAEELGVKTSRIENRNFQEIIKVAGVCEASPSDNGIASASSGGIIKFVAGIKAGKTVARGEVLATISAKDMAGGDPNVNARLAVEIARKELDRLEPLHQEGIVSTRDYNAAKAEYDKAVAASGNASSGSRVTAPISGVITEIYTSDGSYVEQGARIASIIANTSLIVKADVPVRYSAMIRQLKDCNFVFAGLDSVYSLAGLQGKVVSNAAGSVRNGYIPVYFEIRNDGHLLDGMPVEIYLKGDPGKSAIVVPITAVIEQQGVYFVYERLDDNCYRKLPVKLGNSDGVDVEITGGLDAGHEIVTSGALFVKLAESSGAVPEGHSHSH